MSHKQAKKERRKQKIEPPYTCMHNGQSVFTNFGTIEQIKERLQKQREAGL